MSVMPQMLNLLDPAAVEVLKRKVLDGEISPGAFKRVLKRQMLIQFDRLYSQRYKTLARLAGNYIRERFFQRWPGNAQG